MLLEHTTGAVARPVPAPPAEAAARAELRAQIGALEARLAQVAAQAFPRLRVPAGAAPGAGPRLLSLGELERVRDGLAARLGELREAVAEQAGHQAEARALLAAMLADPPAHKWIRVSNTDLGEPGCKHYHVRPRAGLIGMLAGWWHVKISSGCPLPGGP